MPGASRGAGSVRIALLGVTLALGLASRDAGAQDTVAPRAASLGAQDALSPRADSLGAQLVPLVRIRRPFPHGVRIRSLQDHRLRRIYLPLGLVLPLSPGDSTPGQTRQEGSPVSGPDYSALEARLRNRLEARLQKLESAQQESLRALALRLESESATALAGGSEPAARPGPSVLVVPPARSAGPESGTATEPRAAAAAQAPAADAGGTAVIPVPLPLGPSGSDSTAAAVLGADTLASTGAGADSLASVSTPPPPTIVEIERAVLDVGLLRSVNVVFEVNQAALLAPSFPVLEAMGTVLGRYPDVRLEIGGHTDSVGSEEHNRLLSQERAEAVRTYLLTTFSLDPGRLTAVGYGESRPIASNDNATGRTLNRRVEFAVLGRTAPN